MKKYMFLVLAAIGLAACTNDDLGGDNGPAHSGEIEESYIAINLSAAGGTRAEAEFADGTEAERAVSHADFFFFDEAGNPFNVTGNPATAPGGGVNHLRAATIRFAQDANGDDDISDNTSEAVLLLKTYKGQYPSQIVAVLNWSPDHETAYSLTDLHTAVNIQGTFKNSENEDTNYFVMSNAVYAQGTNEVCATALTMENIKTTEDAAKDAPVTIYVERVAAKVQLNANEKYNLNKEVDYVVLSSSTTIKGGVYANILGWDLYRDNSQSHLLKDIDPVTWGVDGVGFNWNEAPWYRSFWATSLSAPENDKVYDGDSPMERGAYTYIGENTTGKSTCTKAVIKAQLVNEDNKPLDIAFWNNVEYVDVPESDKGRGYSLRVAVANTLKHTYFAKTSGGNGAETYTGITPEDLVCVNGDATTAPNGVLANEVYFQLSAEAKGKNWYKLVEGEYKPVANDTANDTGSVNATNDALKSVPAAVLYADGYTFYYVDIKHLGAANSLAEYGIVRNHVYNITINSIGGYGSPVYTGVSFLEYPQITEQNTYVAAQINILSWRLVNQEVDIQPAN